MIYLVLLIFLLVGGALAVLTLENFSIEVQLTLFIWQIPHMPLGLLIIIAFLLGALLLYIISALAALQDHREVKRLRRRVKELEQASLKPSGGSLPGNAASPIVPLPRVPPAPQQ